MGEKHFSKGKGKFIKLLYNLDNLFITEKDDHVIDKHSLKKLFCLY